MSKYIVTGGAGFIGSALVRELLAQGAGKVTVIDNMLSSHTHNLTEVACDVEIQDVDIRDYSRMAPLILSADEVYHLAAIPSEVANVSILGLDIGSDLGQVASMTA